MELHSIPINRIEIRDERFRISVIPSENIAQSVQRHGVLQPLRMVIRDRCQILLSGWKRYWAAQSAGKISVPVLILDQPDDCDCFQEALDENLSIRPLTIIEKANALKRLVALGLDRDVIVPIWLPRLGIPGTLRWLDIYLQFATWDWDIQREVETAKLSIASLELIRKFAVQTARELLPLISPLSRNKQKEFLEFLFEVSLRENLSAGEILNSKEIRDIRGSDMSQLQVSDALRQVLYHRRYPHLTDWLKDFDMLANKIPLTDEIRLSHFANFEEKELSLTFKIRSMEQFKAHTQMLVKLAENVDFQTICRKFCDD